MSIEDTPKGAASTRLHASTPAAPDAARPSVAATPQEVQQVQQLLAQGRAREAISAATRLCQSHPLDGYACHLLGCALAQSGRTTEALERLRHAAVLSPDHPEVLFNLGNLHAALGQLEPARLCLSRVLALRPNLVQACNNLGAVLTALGRRDEALTCYRRAVAINPKHASAHNNLGLTLTSMDRLADAEICFRSALDIEPGFGQAHHNLGLVLERSGRLDAAAASFRKSVQLLPNEADAHVGFGSVLAQLGDLADAEAQLRKALRIAPRHTMARSNLLMVLNYQDRDPLECLAEAREYGRVVTEVAGAPFVQWPARRHAQRLRVGFVSGDLRDHPVGHFLEGVLAHIDPSRFELMAYSSHPGEDELSARLRPHFETWKSLVGVDDPAAAALIHADGNHILIDLSGHTAHNRLPIFARRPAPVQVSWLGYFATTGLSQIDWLLADAVSLPPAHARHFAEKIWHLPATRLCFTEPRFDIPVTEPPALKNGHVTFCCFNNVSKLNDDVLELWSQVLRSVPDSRLFLKARQLGDAAMQRRMTQRFARWGVTGERLIFEGKSPRRDYFAAYQRADIALDPFPFNGATTTVESLWMGVPVLSLAGDRLVSRQGVGLLQNAGLAPWIAHDRDEYVRLASRHAGDLPALAQLRSRLRSQAVASPIFDGVRFARDLESAWRGMWERFEAGTGHPR